MNQQKDSPRLDNIAIKKDRKVAEQQHNVKHKNGLIAKFQYMLFGQKRERPENPKHQIPMQLEADSERVEQHTEGYDQKTTYQRKKKQHPHHKGRLTLPVEEVEIYPEGDLSKMVFIGKEITDELEIVPARLFIKRSVRYKYAAKNENGELIQNDEQPKRVINNGILGPALLTSILIDKYADTDNFSLYQQRPHIKHQHDSNARSAIKGWTRQGLKKLKELCEHLLESTMSQGYIHTDEALSPTTLSESVEQSPDAQNQPSKILEYIHGEYTNPAFSVTMIAQRLNTSKSALYREWNRHHSESIANYITNLRLNEAKQLLLKETYPIREVADMSGFSSQSYFTKVFKKKVGVSPTSYQSEKGR